MFEMLRTLWEERRPLVLAGGGILFLIIILVIVAVATGGNDTRTPPPAPPGPVEITIWNLFEDSANVQPILQDYQQLHPETRITYQVKRVEDYEQELLDALAEGRGPDIFVIRSDWLPKYQNKLAPAPDLLFTLREFRETFAPVIAGDFLVDSKIWALPLSIDALGLYVNRDLLADAGIASPPRTWEEVSAAVRKITRRSGTGNFLVSGIALGTQSNINRAVDNLLLLMLQNNTQFYDPESRFTLFDQGVSYPNGEVFYPGRNALEFYTQFANPAKDVYTWNARQAYSIDAFTQGKLGMMLGYAYVREILRAQAPHLAFEIAPVPQISLAGPRTNLSLYWALAVSKQSAHQQTAWDFLKFATTKGELAKLYELHKQPSPRRDMIQQQIADPEIGVFAEGALLSRSVWKPDAQAFEAVFQQMIDQVVLQGSEPFQALSSAAQSVNQLLQARQYPSR
jgi:multiple sugar transport system substrate-binding protein